LIAAWPQTGRAQLTDDAPIGVELMDQSAIVPIVIAHRGASGYLPEHTLESAAMAHALGADFIEQDCVLSRDGIPVVLHDLILDDVTNVAGVFPDRCRSDGHWHVADFDLAELRTLNVTERRSPKRAWKDAGMRFPLESGSFRISTLDEHLTLIRGLNVSRGREAGVYVEVKEPAAHRNAGLDASTAVLKVLADHGYDSAGSRAFVQCFDRDEVIRIRRDLNCRLPLIWLLDTMPEPGSIHEAASFCDGLGVSVKLVVSGAIEQQPQVTPLVSQAHAAGLLVHVWTVRTDALPAFATDTATLLEWLIVSAGVDGLFADQPDVVLKWRQEKLSQEPGSQPFRLLNDRPESSVAPAGR
jgi:glycerophosphoryl diester phosphodiesterase